jgi:DNA (cytosine-5)-methyltransferase 1
VTPRIGSLFSGAGGLDLAVEAATGGRTIWQCENAPAATKVLAAHWPGVTNLGDITTTNWTWVEPVDILCGGFPCQDVSAAGRRAGIKTGTRSGLWAYFAEAIDQLRPQLVIIENVRGLLNARAHRAMESADPTLGDSPDGPFLRAAGAVLGDLADIGYDAQWQTISAASVGAPHRRERVFILATDAQRLGCDIGVTESAITRGPSKRPSDRTGARVVADAARNGRNQGRPKPAGLIGGSDAAVSGDGPIGLLPTPMANDGRGGYDTTDPARQRGLLKNMVSVLPTPQARDWRGGQSNQFDLNDAVNSLLPTPRTTDQYGAGAHGEGGLDLRTAVVSTQWGKYQAAVERWEATTRPAPHPTEPNTKGRPRLAAAFSEWMMGWPAGWATAIPGINRSDALRIIGNGVVPQQALAAITELLEVSERGSP